MPERIDHFLALLASRGSAPRTQRDHARHLTELRAYLEGTVGAVVWDALTPQLLRDYADHLAAGGDSPGQVRRKLASARVFRSYLNAEGVVPPAPAAAMRAAAPAPLTAREVRAILRTVTDPTPADLRDTAFFRLAYATAWPCVALLRLDLSALTQRQPFVVVEAADATTRLPDGTAEALTRYLREGRPALARRRRPRALFVSRAGRRLSSAAIQRRLRQRARRVELSRPVTFQALRKSALAQR